MSSPLVVCNWYQCHQNSKRDLYQTSWDEIHPKQSRFLLPFVLISTVSSSSSFPIMLWSPVMMFISPHCTLMHCFYPQNNYFLVSNAHCHQEMLVCSFLLYYFTSILLFILFLQLRTLEIRQEWPEENGKMWMVHKPEEPLGQYVIGLVSIGFWCVEMGASNCKVVLHEVISNEGLHEFT